MKAAIKPGVVFRLGRKPDPWSWPDWQYADSAGTFGNRFDDPQGLYRVLYASTQRLATFVECLAYFRPDPELVAEYASIAGSEGDVEPVPLGVVPREWIKARCMGIGALKGSYCEPSIGRRAAGSGPFHGAADGPTGESACSVHVIGRASFQISAGTELEARARGVALAGT